MSSNKQQPHQLADSAKKRLAALARHEWKYILNEARAAQVLQTFGPYLQQDSFARRNHGRYRIVSLYADSADLALHRATIEGGRDRFKLRIRSYSDDPTAPVFLEIKHRNNAVIAKARCKVPKTILGQVFNGTSVAANTELSDPVVHDEFIERLTLLRGRPMVLVRYTREAHVGLTDSKVRVTFDRNIASAAPTGPEVRFDGNNWRAVPGGGVLLEIKYSGLCPGWIADGIQRLGLRRTSFSKYSKSVINQGEHGAEAWA